MKYRKYYIFILICFVLMLSACGKDDEKVDASEKPEKVDLSGYPVGIQEGKISLEYYTILIDANEKYGKLHADLKNTSTGNIEDKKDLYRKFLVYVNGLNYSVSNDPEKEIDNYFTSFLYNAKHYAEYKIKTYDSKSDLDNSVAKDYLLDAQNDMLMVIEIMNKYQLFLED